LDRDRDSVADPDPGSRTWCLFAPWIRDPRWVNNQDPDTGSGSGMNNPDHIFESLKTIFWVKILKFFDAEPGFGMEKFRSGINIPDPQHCKTL